MKSEMTADEKFKRMTETPINKLVLTLAVPTIVSMLTTSIYNMADTFFVSQISTSASGAVGVAFPLMMIIQAIGFTLGMGSGNYISRLLGQKNREYSSKVLATGFFTALILGTALAIVGLIFIDPLVYILGATDTIAPHAKAYIQYILIGIPFMTASFVMNGTLRFQGSAFYAMIGIATGGVLNIVLDPIFIFTFNMGTGGAALATIISQFISFCILFYNSSKGGNLKIKIKDFSPEWVVYKEILRGGLPSFYRQALGSIALICLNFSAGIYGDAAIAAMSIVGRVIHFAVSVMLGLGQGFQPICGFNYGAKLYDRVLSAFWFTAKLSVTALAILGIIGFITSPIVIQAFRKEDLEVIAIGSLALRLQSLTLPLSAWIIMTNMLVQTIGKSKEASIVSISRQGLFFIPSILILPRILGLLGVQLSQPVSDVCSFILAVFISKEVLNELRSQQEEQENLIVSKEIDR
ncbi:MATE family efflux transporter [Tissierella sp. Yu-01]|uniref:MATE family efflux transporter n=1 Tax=Tissierella sp. Yu-01 TaxID=3035694 RepID=UPI00240D8717|nr:MATE family efflux transporter [Tissierella sp. Yu-01]WFA09045.1 MATE family efflux transporter [Tissierella sp. Yu-01]